MQILIVSFALEGLSADDFRAGCVEIAPAFAAVPGLRSKTWLASPETNTWGGVYLFDDRAALDAYLQSPLFAEVRANPAFVDQRMATFEVLEEPSAITGSAAALAG
jgi:quinol monooxygenase YgiN